MALNKFKRSVVAVTLAIGALLSAGSAWADAELDAIKATISSNWATTMPSVPGGAQEVRRTAIPGLYEVRVGRAEIIYTDATGDYVIYGDLLDLRNKRNLTQERTNLLMAIQFDDLPFDNAIVLKRGDGSRRLAVFEDPNCSYCLKLEQQLQSVDNVTIYVFLYPILSPDSHIKSRDIWCAQDRAKAWLDWAVNQKQPAEARCDTLPIQSNVEWGSLNGVSGTPTMFFEDGTRIGGFVDIPAVEKALNQAHRAK